MAVCTFARCTCRQKTFSASMAEMKPTAAH